jgi:hypothetical protein
MMGETLRRRTDSPDINAVCPSDDDLFKMIVPHFPASTSKLLRVLPIKDHATNQRKLLVRLEALRKAGLIGTVLDCSRCYYLWVLPKHARPGNLKTKNRYRKRSKQKQPVEV